MTERSTSESSTPALAAGVLGRNRGFVAVFCASAALTALALTYVYSERYEAVSVIEYRPQEVTRLKAPDPQSFGSPVPQAPFKVISQTLQELAGSASVMRRVVEEFKLYSKDRVYSGPWWRVWFMQAKDWLRDTGGDIWTVMKYGRLIEQDPVEGAVAELRNAVKLRNRDSYIFTLTVQDKTPERAAAIANRIGTLLVEELRNSERDPGEAKREQLGALLQAKATQITEVRNEIQGLLRSNNVASVSIETERTMERLSALELDRSKLTADIERAQRRLDKIGEKQGIKSRLAREVASERAAVLAAADGGAAEEASGASGTGEGGNPRSEAAAASAGLGTDPVAAAQLTPDARHALRNLLTARRAAGGAASAAATSAELISPDDFKKLSSERVFEELEVSGLVAKKAALDASVRNLTARLHLLPELQTRLDAARMRLAALERDYVQLADAYAEADVRASAVLSEVNVVDAAIPPSLPKSPIKVYHVGLAATLGLVVAIGLVYLLTYFNVRIFFASKGVRGRQPLVPTVPLTESARRESSDAA